MSTTARHRWSATRRLPRAATWLSMVALLALAACGAPAPTTEAEEDPTTAGTQAAGELTCVDASAERLEEVYAEVEGLDPEARREALIELAAENGPLNLYASTNPDDAEVLLAAFTELTGVEVEHYRANASSIRNRLLQEMQAGQPGADAIVMDGTEMAAIDSEGLLLPLKSPHLEDFPDSAVFGNWAAPTSNAYIATWNSNELSGDAAPASWEDVLTYEGPLGIEISDYDWFATLVKHHFMAEEGMTEEEAVDLFRQAASAGTPVDGHTLLVELLIAGEFDLVTSAYHHRVRSVIEEEGAPIAWVEPQPVEPVILRPSGVAVAACADNPAAALLYADFLLSPEGQQVYVELNRTPNSTTIEGGISSDIDTLPVDLVAVTEEREKWESLYAEIISGMQQEVRAE